MEGNLGSWFIFGRLACGTSIYVIFGKLGETRPPVLSGDEFIGFPTARVASCRVIVVHVEEVSTKCVIFWDVDVASIEDNSIF